MITLRPFNGIVPRLPSASLKPGYAEIAHDVRLWHGTLKSWREPKVIQQIPETTKTIHQWGCCWFNWDDCVEVAQWTAICPRLYVTGDGDYPQVLPLNADCSVGCGDFPSMRLGVPAPAAAAQVTAVPVAPVSPDAIFADGEIRETRTYVYTYENCLGEEGPPSWPSREIVVDDGSAVTLTGLSVPSTEWGITKINIYRGMTGLVTESEAVGAEQMRTDYFYVGTIDVGITTYVDSAKNVDALGRALATIDVLEPPAGLRGITALANTNTLVGFEKNVLMFSANNQPWNWPHAQRYTLDDNIVSVKDMGGFVAVMTDGHPYFVKLNDSSKDRVCHTVVRHAYPMPMITCCSDRGSISTPLGVFYVTSRGLAAMAGNSRPVLVTEPWFAHDDWRKLKPETMRLGYYDGTVFCVSDNYAFMLFLDETVYGKLDNMKLTTFSDRPDFMHLGRNGELFFAEDGQILQWDAGADLRPYQWKSCQIITTDYRFFGAFRLWAEGAVRMTLYTEEREVFDDVVAPIDAYRLPRYGHHLRHSVELRGIFQVESLELAIDRWGLTQTGG